MYAVSGRLAQAMHDAAARNGIGIVRSSMIGTGHDVCSAEPYVAGGHPARHPGWPTPAAYHPTQLGMDRIAAALEAVIDP